MLLKQSRHIGVCALDGRQKYREFSELPDQLCRLINIFLLFEIEFRKLGLDGFQQFGRFEVVFIFEPRHVCLDGAYTESINMV